MNRSLVESLDAIRQKAQERNLVENEFLQLFKIFFFSSRFELDEFQSGKLYADLFRMITLNDSTILTNVATFFKLNQKNL